MTFTSPTLRPVILEKALKPSPVMTIIVPVGPLVGSTVIVAWGTSWVAVVGTVVLSNVYSASTELVEGITDCSGTVKVPLMLPAASGVSVATVRTVPGIV